MFEGEQLPIPRPGWWIMSETLGESGSASTEFGVSVSPSGHMSVLASRNGEQVARPAGAFRTRLPDTSVVVEPTPDGCNGTGTRCIRRSPRPRGDFTGVMGPFQGPLMLRLSLM